MASGAHHLQKATNVQTEPTKKKIKLLYLLKGDER